MTREEFDALLTSAANPDTAPLALAELREGVGGLFVRLDENERTMSERDKTISDLRDTNMRLFLKIGATVDSGADDTHEETVDELNERLRKAARGES